MEGHIEYIYTYIHTILTNYAGFRFFLTVIIFGFITRIWLDITPIVSLIVLIQQYTVVSCCKLSTRFHRARLDTSFSTIFLKSRKL
jgi:hypothetical protein